MPRPTTANSSVNALLCDAGAGTTNHISAGSLLRAAKGERDTRKEGQVRGDGRCLLLPVCSPHTSCLPPILSPRQLQVPPTLNRLSFP